MLEFIHKMIKGRKTQEERIIEFLKDDGAKIIYSDGHIDLGGNSFDSPVMVVMKDRVGVVNFRSVVASGYIGVIIFSQGMLVKKAVYGCGKEKIFNGILRIKSNSPTSYHGITLMWNDSDIRTRSPE